MKKYICFIIILFLTASVSAQESLHEKLEPLKPFIGKTWRGEFTNSTPDKPIIDVSKWERILNGQAIRITHSLNNGEYGGETIVFYDKEKDQLSFYYFTTAGFYTTGKVWFEDGKFISKETVKGNDEGITEVKAVAEILPDGKLISKSQYLKNGKWVDGHKAVYNEEPEAELIFK